MAKKIDGYIKLQVPAGQANPSPPIGSRFSSSGPTRSRRNARSVVLPPAKKCSDCGRPEIASPVEAGSSFDWPKVGATPARTI